MKYLIKKSLVFVVLFTTLLVKANEISSLSNLNDEKTTVLTLENVKQGSKLYIKDAFGVVLYKESIKNSGDYVKGFDLTSLPDGSYYFELNRDLEIKTVPFTVKMNVVEFQKELETTIYKPFISVKDNYVILSKLSLSKQPLEIKIYFDYDTNSYEVIHSEKIDNKVNIQKAFKLSEYEEGNYKVVVKTEGRTFVEFFDGNFEINQSIKQTKNKTKKVGNSNNNAKFGEESILNLKGGYYAGLHK